MAPLLRAANTIGVIPRANFGVTVKPAFRSNKTYISPRSWASGSSLLPTVIGTFAGVVVEPPHADKIIMGTSANSTKNFVRNERVRKAISFSLNLNERNTGVQHMILHEIMSCFGCCCLLLHF